MGPEILSSIGAGVWRKAPMAFPDSSSVLDKFQSAILSWNYDSCIILAVCTILFELITVQIQKQSNHVTVIAEIS